MTKRAIVLASDLAVLEQVPSEAPVIVDFADRACDESVLGRCADLRLRVELVLVRAESLADPRLEAFLEIPGEVLVVLDRSASIREALAAGRRLARPSLQVELRLDESTDLDVIKILSSLGVRSRIPVSRLAGGGELLLDAITDTWLSGVRRAPVAPFAELERHLGADEFELAQLDHRENDHHVDLRGRRDGGPIDWETPRVSDKRIPFLLDRHPCAFCEGLCFCHGYLLDQGHPDRCRDFFSEVLPTLALAEARRAVRQASASEARPEARRQSGAPPRAPRPRARRSLPIAPDAPARGGSAASPRRLRTKRGEPC